MRDRPHLESAALGEGGQPQPGSQVTGRFLLVPSSDTPTDQPITARWDNVLDEAELAALLDQLPAT